MAVSHTEALKTLEAQVGKTGTRPLWLGLSSTAPTNGVPVTNITEPPIGTNGYTRAPITGATWGAAAVVTGVPTIGNALPITFPVAAANLLNGVTFTHGVLFGSASGSDVVAYGLFGTGGSVLKDAQVVLAPGAFTVTMT